jgi:hypothetical protein
MPVLGINPVVHDPAAALVIDGRVVAAVEEERFSRRKHGKRPGVVLRLGNCRVCPPPDVCPPRVSTPPALMRRPTPSTGHVLPPSIHGCR